MDETTTARETTPTHTDTAGRSSFHATGTMPDPPDAGGDPVVPSLRPEVAQQLLTDIETGLITYVLDTSVLLADPLSLTRFAEHDIVLPIVVVTELEAKRHHPDLGYFARQALRILDDLRDRHGNLSVPLPIGKDGGHVHVELNHQSTSSLPDGFRLGDNDTRILAVAKNLQLEGKHVVLVSKDLPMRIKASASGIHAEEYRAALARDRGYTGMVTAGVDEQRMSDLYDGELIDIPEVAHHPVHTGVTVTSPRGSALGRITRDKQVRLVPGDQSVFGVSGRSAEQRHRPAAGRVDRDRLPRWSRRHLQERSGPVHRPGGRARAARPAQDHGLPPPVRGGRPGARVPAGRPGREDGALGAGGLRHTRLDGVPERDRRGRFPRHARGAAADPYPRTLPARRLRDRRRGPVARAQRAADDALAHRSELPRGAHPRHRPARQPADRPL